MLNHLLNTPMKLRKMNNMVYCPYQLTVITGYFNCFLLNFDMVRDLKKLILDLLAPLVLMLEVCLFL